MFWVFGKKKINIVFIIWDSYWILLCLRGSNYAVAPTYVAEVIAGECPLAELVTQLVQVSAVQLQHLAAVKAELVRSRGDVSPLRVVLGAGFRQTGEFLW